MTDEYDYTIEEANKHLASGLVRATGVKPGSETVDFYCKDGAIVRLYHDQNCCETVLLDDCETYHNDEDIYTDAAFCKLEEVSCDNTDAAPKNKDIEQVSHTWTFYKITTDKGYDTLRWYGTSNGWYSEDVDLKII